MSDPEKDMIEILKQKMSYVEISCEECKSFVPTDCSGSHNAKSQHCNLNPVIDIPVDKHGCCKFFKAKEK